MYPNAPLLGYRGGMPTPETKSTRRREATRERLLDAARDVLASSGIQGATVEEICDRAGFTRGAFYSNFETKDDLVLDLFRREKDLMLGRVQAALDIELRSRAETDAETILRVLDQFLGSQPTDRTWFLVHQEFVIHGVRQREIAAVYQELWTQTQAEFATIITGAVEALQRKLALPVEQMTLILMGVFDEAMRNAFLSNSADDFDATVLREMLPALLMAVSEPL